MVSVIDLRKQYIKLYAQMRKKLWTYEVIECLAFFEDMILHRFPDMKKCRNQFNLLYNLCREECRNDEELEDEFKAFKSLLEENEVGFSYIDINYKS